jgi:hypothetical protein
MYSHVKNNPNLILLIFRFTVNVRKKNKEKVEFQNTQMGPLLKVLAN